MLICANYVFPITSSPISNGAVLVRGNKILDVGEAAMLKLRYPQEEVVDFGLSALMPGLIDLHTHLENTALRGVVGDVPFSSWFVQVVEKSMRLEASDWYDSAVLGGLDALSSGITTICDISSTGAVAQAIQEVGMRGVIYREVGVRDKTRLGYAMRTAMRDIDHWQREVDADRIVIGIAPSSVYSIHPSVFTSTAECASKYNLPLAMRLAGSREEFNFVKYGSSMFSVHTMDNAMRGYVEIPPWMPTGETPVRYALNWGAFEAPNVLMVHAVHVDDDDIKKLREYNVAVAVCARANAQLGMGVAPVDKFLRAGLRTGWGTDSPAATESTDMLAEIRVGMLIQRALNDRRFLDTATVLEMATIGGARALGLEDKIGSLEIGKCADIIAVDLSSSRQSPNSNPVSAVVNTCSASDVLMTMVDGKVLYEKNRWHVDVEVAKNIARVIEIRAKLRD